MGGIERGIVKRLGDNALVRMVKENKRIVCEKILPLVKQAQTLSQKYDVVCTNPPYMGGSGVRICEEMLFRGKVGFVCSYYYKMS